MAEKPDDQVTIDEKIAKGKELFGRGARNFYVKCYVDAADDLSEAAKLYGEAYGIDGDELGEVYLLYAKALIAIGQDENKLIEVPEEDEEENDEPAEEDDGEIENVNNENSIQEKTNGHSDEQKENEPEAGPSSGVSNSNENSNDVAEEENENEEEGSNLEVAWEVLQNAALIFQRQEDKGLKNLLEVYNEMAGISMENGNFTLALDDFSRALNTFDCIEDSEKNDRIAAEIHYKIGLCQSMEKAYDEAVKAFQKAHDLIAEVIEKEKAKTEQNDDILANIKDLEETQQEIMNKITEIGEVKADEIEQVKRELTKLYGVNGNDPGAGCSSSSTIPTVAATSSSTKSPEAEKPKPTDISHLIKRKKPDSDAVENSPAKKKIIETSPEENKPTAIPIEVQEEKVVEETATVQVAVDN
ncbi:hypothetical protein PVAND_011311 [Polypedilum vanderplanki]|uniref:Tetratricopeptide SHNi-TPR domain-containing protein n=1 Tax=Polypedilum vanderplanki TaxID=319348 RepID=A0A9J6CJK5_POLVA|nr:hypothetical protein PVAND_011311 [Polypedilum vanderplanki]